MAVLGHKRPAPTYPLFTELPRELVSGKLETLMQEQGAGKRWLRSFRGPIFFWLPLCLLGTYLYLELLRKFSELAPLAPAIAEKSTDMLLYREAGEAILAGDVPYRDFFIEYPPGSLLAFVPPAFFTTNQEDFTTFFASEMALVLVATLVLTACAARILLGWWWPLPAVVFTVAALLLYPVAVTRYDALVALTLAAASALVAGVSTLGPTNTAGSAALTAAWASLGFGAAVKLVPALASAPLVLFSGSRQGLRTLKDTVQGAAWGLAVFFGVLILFYLPAFLFGGESVVGSLAYHANRGLQVESVGASVLMMLGYLEEVVFEYGAFEVLGHGVELLSSLSLPVTVLLLIVTGAVAYREYRESGFGARQFPRFAAAFVLAFLLGSKVLSPQYIIWLLPLVPLSARGVWAVLVSGLFLAICWLTTQIFPYHYGEILRLESSGTSVLLWRNVLLVMLWVWMLLLASESTQQPSRE